jgi:hypothetical protein
MKCDSCGAELQIGEWPWCPHGDARGFGDKPIEPYMDEMLGPEPVEITSRGQRRAIMSKAHLDYHDVSRSKRGRIYVDMRGR